MLLQYCCHCGVVFDGQISFSLVKQDERFKFLLKIQQHSLFGNQTKISPFYCCQKESSSSDCTAFQFFLCFYILSFLFSSKFLFMCEDSSLHGRRYMGHVPFRLCSRWFGFFCCYLSSGFEVFQPQIWKNTRYRLDSVRMILLYQFVKLTKVAGDSEKS